MTVDGVGIVGMVVAMPMAMGAHNWSRSHAKARLECNNSRGMSLLHSTSIVASHPGGCWRADPKTCRQSNPK